MMGGLFYVPTVGVEDWRLRLARPEEHWAVGRSAMMLACCWEDAAGFPPEVSQLLNTLPSEYRPIEFVVGFPEHKTSLPSRGFPSRTDVLVVAASSNGLVAIAVEGKVDEGFNKRVSKWLGAEPSKGRTERLRFLYEALGLTKESVADLPYQLIHRAGSAVIEANRFRATPMMMVHSWGAADEGFEDYARLLNLMRTDAQPGRVSVGRLPDDREILFGWVRGDERWRPFLA